jgi:hypothetical protein
MQKIMSLSIESENKSKSFCWVKCFWCFLLILILYSFSNNVAIGKDLLEWDQTRLKAEVSIAERYNDNIYLTNGNEVDDFVTRLSPELELETALTTRSKVNLSYTGIFDHYNEADNFRSDHHFGDVNFQIESAKESSFQLGTKFENGANQPNSIEDESANFWLAEIYSDLQWRMTSITSLGAGYQHSVQSFDEDRYQRDDFVRDNIRLDLLHARSQNLPLLLEYRFEKQVNENIEPDSGELISHAVLAGCRWRPERRLSGTFELGYFWSQFNQTDAVNGWMIDADILYHVSQFTDIEISANRKVQISEYADRDTLDYNIFSTYGLTLSNRRLDPLEFSVAGAYENRDFRQINTDATGREDDLYRFSIQSDYQLKKWLALAVDYSYRTNQSNVNSQEYQENIVQFEIIFSI